MKNEHPRVFGLDLLRATAVLLVLLAHTIPYVSKSQFVKSISSFSAVIGVEFFFVLSGFLIGTILIKMHNQNKITDIHTIKIFWIRRWFRTLPNYYLVLIVSAILFYLTTKQFIFATVYGLSFFVFLQNFTSQFTNYFFGVSWSLAVEEWFYLLFPLLLFIIQLVFPHKKRSFFIVILLFILIPLSIKIYLALFNSGIAWDAGYRKIAVLRLDAIGFGVLVAYINYYKKTFFQKRKILLFLLGLILFTILNILFYKLHLVNYDFENEKQLHDSGFFMNTFFFTFMSLSIGLLIPLLCSIKIKETNLVYKGVKFISLISYSIYLSHPFYIFLCTYIPAKLNLSISIEFIIILIWITTIIGSYFQYKFFEVKFTVMRDRFGMKSDRITV